MDSTNPAYSAALRAVCDQLSRGDALECLREVLAQSDGSEHTSAILILGVLSYEVGDIQAASALEDYVLENRPPDPFVARHVASSSLNLDGSRAGGDSGPLLIVNAFINRPLVAYSVALAGAFLVKGQTRQAAKALETIVDAALSPGTDEPWNQPLPPGVPPSDDQSERLADGLEEMLCHLYEELSDPDSALDIIRRFPASDLTLQRGRAFEQQGRNDAAFDAYSEGIKADRDPSIVARARYARARLLIADCQPELARNDIAAIYGQYPEFPDDEGLRAKLELT